MKRIWPTIACVMMLCGSCAASGSFATATGEAVGMCLASWAPCVALHQAYGEYLFQGAIPSAPGGLESALRQTQAELQRLLLLLVEQADPPTDSVIASTSLLEKLGESGYEPIFLRIDEQAHEDPETLLPILEEAADYGFFVMILEVKEGLDALVEALLLAFDERSDQYIFSAAFIAEGLLAAPNTAEVDPQWIEALMFLRDAPVGALPVGAGDAVSRLIDLAEAPGQLSSEDWQTIRSEAVRLKASLREVREEAISDEPSTDQGGNEAIGPSDGHRSDTTTSTRRLTAAIAVGVGLVIVLGLGVLAAVSSR